MSRSDKPHRGRTSTPKSKRPPRRRLTPSIERLRAVTARAAVSNGSRLLLGELDARSVFARRMHDLASSYYSDLGGKDHLSEAQRAHVNLIVHLQLQCELMAARFASNENNEASKTMLDQYLRASGALSRLLRAIGIKRKAKNVTPSTPRDYLELKARRQRMEAAE